MVEHIHYKMLRNLILHITYLISRLHSSINKRIASRFEMISIIRGARQQPPFSMNAGSTLLQRRTVETLVRRCTEPDSTGSRKASQFWDADAPFASMSLVRCKRVPVYNISQSVWCKMCYYQFISGRFQKNELF